MNENINEEPKQAFPETVTNITDSITDAAKPYGKQIGESIDNNINKFKSRFLEITGWKDISIDSLVDGIGDKLEDVTEVMDDPKFEQQLHKFLTVAKVPIVETIKTSSEIASESIGDVAEDTTHLIGNLIAEVPPFNIVINSIFAAENAVKAARTSAEAINEIVDKAVETGHKIEDQLNDTTSQVNGMTNDVIQNVSNSANALTEDISNQGRNLIQKSSNNANAFIEQGKNKAAEELSKKAFGDNYVGQTIGKDYMKNKINNNVPQIPQLQVTNIPVTGGSSKKQNFSTKLRKMRSKNMNTMKRIKNSVNKMLHGKSKKRATSNKNVNKTKTHKNNKLIN